jgi:hypothetical protein
LRRRTPTQAPLPGWRLSFWRRVKLTRRQTGERAAGDFDLAENVLASAGDIMSQVLTESITLSLLGGIMGIALGALFSTLISSLTPVPSSVEMWSVGVGVIITAAVGLFFGWIPARRAAMLDPIEALRRE